MGNKIFKDVMMTFGLIILFWGNSNAQVGMGTATPISAAALDITSTNKGFLPPRMTHAQKTAIASPAAGLTVWCTDCGSRGEMQVYNGYAWTNMVGSAAALGMVTSNLVLNLDAGNPNSYAGFGTTWTDLSGLSNNGTLVNGPTYSSANGGSIVFDGLNDYVNCGNPSISIGKITVNAWVKITTGSVFQHIVDSGSDSWHLAILNDNRPYFYNGSTYHTAAPILEVNKWYLITGVQGATLDIYINGVLGQSIATNANVTTNNLSVGRWQSGSRPLNGNIAQVLINNIALSQAEILQFFNATKAKYGYFSAPTVTTTALSSITGTTASSGGTVTATGGAAITAQGVCWSTTTAPTTANSKTIDGTTSPFTSSITGLTGGTTYYVRAYATYSSGTNYGQVISFTTPN